jgi:preprotein translocase subunit SecD
MADRRPIVLISLTLFTGLLMAMMLWVFLYGRPVLMYYQFTLKFESPPTKAELDDTLTRLRARLQQLAPPEWRAEVVRQLDTSFLLRYVKSGEPGDLAYKMAQQGVCEFRLLGMDKAALDKALKDGPPEGQEIMQFLETCDGFNERTGEPIRREYPKLVSVEPVLTPAGFQDVTFETKGLAKFVHVRFTLHPEDSAKLTALSKTHSGQVLAIVVDGIIRIRVRIGGPIIDNEMEIQDLLDIVETEKLVKVLRTGPVQGPLKVADMRSRPVMAYDDP